MSCCFRFKPAMSLLAILSVTACSDDKPDLTSEVNALIDELAISADPAAGRNLPDISEPKAQLGMRVFFTKGLSLNDTGETKDSACVSCHHPMLGGGDDLSLPIGVDAEAPDLLGPGRFHELGSHGYDGGPTVPRNAPTTFNIGLWDQVLFHDGRVESLGKTAGSNGDDGSGIRTPDSAFGVADVNSGANLPTAQSRFPVTSPEEMKGHVFAGDNDAVRTQLEGEMAVAWSDEFNAAFGDSNGVSYARIAEVIGEYERSQVFVDTPWKAFVEGDAGALSVAAQRGALLFYRTLDQGGADCASCHSGAFFTDEQFHVLAMPQIGRGKGDGATGSDDFGRFRETGAAADMYAFRTPSLINVEVTGPWSHAGAYASLEAVVRHHLNPEQAVMNYDYAQLDPSIQAFEMQFNTQNAVAQLNANRAASLPSIQDVELSDQQVGDLVEFLKALTDPCVKDRACMASWIPDASDTNPDALRINAVDISGNYL